MPDGVEIVGEEPPATELKELEQLRDHVAGEGARGRALTHAQWLFGSASAVGVVSAGATSVEGLPPLTGLGQLLYLLAFVALAACLVFASMALAPVWGHASTRVLDDLRRFVNDAHVQRGRLVRLSAWAFAAALLLAALAPLSSLGTDARAPGPAPASISPASSIAFGFVADGQLEARLSAVGRAPGTLATLEAQTLDGLVLGRAVACVVTAGLTEVPLRLAAPALRRAGAEVRLVCADAVAVTSEVVVLLAAPALGRDLSHSFSAKGDLVVELTARGPEGSEVALVVRPPTSRRGTALGRAVGRIDGDGGATLRLTVPRASLTPHDGQRVRLEATIDGERGPRAEVLVRPR